MKFCCNMAEFFRGKGNSYLAEMAGGEREELRDMDCLVLARRLEGIMVVPFGRF